MNKKVIVVFGMLATGMASGILGVSPVSAQQVASIGQATTAPIGFMQFCRENPAECVSRTLPRRAIALDEGSWRRIVKINADVNREIIAVTDQDHWGVPELWSYPEDGRGDCEDYVLEKRRRLIRAGFPEQALLITVVRDKRGDGHAVLTIKTDRGDFVLDNQEGQILAWKDTGYRFIKRQSDENPAQWVSLGGVGSPNVASSR
ncbi:MAG: transglutaminase-like cysteine peptidase [Hyphomicrobiales bacterium]|uniref:transglutaminase-like cysteine peptidase n=1 Tax=Rhabdaerophilum calidifontis TaxID=2604328 RepID=UPI001FE8AE7F|nr:transglutaminase-like cysteine peptidase [Rhabdaerophilum calidifontis]MCA1952683.1 transglutaminase-like cysteine peptidase [Hyphomicrobiales bacterium]MCA1998613.1 transglutaminase-like cysteine peptidase [Hyphomicrobiales bacterium]